MIQELLRQHLQYRWVGIDRAKIGHFIGRFNSIIRGRSPKTIWETPIFFMIHAIASESRGVVTHTSKYNTVYIIKKTIIILLPRRVIHPKRVEQSQFFFRTTSGNSATVLYIGVILNVVVCTARIS